MHRYVGIIADGHRCVVLGLGLCLVVYTPVAPVVQVVNLEFYMFETWVRAPGGSGFDFICKNKKIKKDSIVQSALQRG